MEPVRYPQGRNMSGGRGYNMNPQHNNGGGSRQGQRQQCPNQTASANTPCRDRHDHDFDDFPVGIGYVPWQRWGELYSPEKGLCEGTIFVDLNLIFCGKRGNRA